MTPQLAGACLVVCAGLWNGVLQSSALRREVSRLEALSRMLELAACELERFRTPLPELFALLSENNEGAAAELCRRAAEGLAVGLGISGAWEASLKGMSSREREILHPLGSVLGRYGAEEQAAAVRGAQRRMEALCAASRAELRDKCRMRLGLSAAAGAVLAVLLL